MLNTTQARILKKFSDLKFEPVKHQYFLAGQYLPSVTGLIKRHFPPFNKDQMIKTRKGTFSLLALSAMKASREEGREITTHELERKWQLINTNACDLGHKVHKFLEDYTGIEVPSLPQEVAGIKYLNSLKGKYKISFRELRAYSKKYTYAGTMDLPLEVIGSSKESFIISDYKTNGDLFKAYDYMYPPFETLEASLFNADQLQLSYYQIILEEAELNIIDRTIIHLKADGEFKTYHLYDFTQELKDYMKHIAKYN